ncbi:unnamed protein product [Cylicocyclus nassatus]|uniref:SSD domain-containing protein n=1 Tax=Cylicocyclus nassatus TaxID=53992 RepID=A0AA36HBP7_CYLNA|nr:unnamed protein product [Cylicocyclus nassatus]
MLILCDWISCHPRRTLAVVFAGLLPLFSFFLLYPVEIESDVRRGFAEKGGRSEKEFKRFADFYNITYEGLEIWAVLVTEKRSTGRKYMNMSMELLNEVERLDKYVHNVSVVVDDTVIHYDDLHGIEINYVFNWYKYAYSWSDFFADINLTYPVGTAMGHKFFIGSHFFGVNKHKESFRGPIEKMEFVTLWYMNQTPNMRERKRLQALQLELFRLSRLDNFSDLISFEMYGDQVANAEMLRGTVYTVNLFVVGVILMVAFMAFAFNHLILRSQIILILAAVGSPAIATATCFAILGWIGFPFNSIMCITPFLVMGIGVDDAFLLLHAWRRYGKHPVKERMRIVVQQIGPSMAITSATNTVAFGVGVFSPTPQMSGFCLCTCFAIFLDFVFEFLIFAPFIVMFYQAKDHKPAKEKKKRRVTWRKFTKVLTSNVGRVSVILITAILYVCAYIGLSDMNPSFDPSKTFPYDSDLLISLRNFERVQSEYSPINFISAMPNVSEPQELSSFLEMIGRLEHSDGCYGPERTQVLLRDFLEWGEANNETLTLDDLPAYLSVRKIKDVNIVQYNMTNGTVDSALMNYIVICRGDLDWNLRATKIDRMRKIIDEYPQFQTSLFDYDSTIYDLIIAVKDELIKAVLITFACMTLACAFMIPSLTGASIATLSMLSISFTLLGILALWGQSLDPVTMINVLMAIGLSVDFSAHVCYHYHLGQRDGLLLKADERITKILRAVGRPMAEASLSTLICMFPLFFVPVYIIVAFAKTVCLVSLLGLFHGIVIIPVCLSFLIRTKDMPRNNLVLNEQKETMLT